MKEAGILNPGTRQDLQEATSHVYSSSEGVVSKGEDARRADGSQGRGVGPDESRGGGGCEGGRIRGSRGGGVYCGCDVVNSVGCCGKGSFGVRRETLAGMSPRIYYVPDGTDTREGDRDRMGREAGGGRRSPEKQGRILGRIGESARGGTRGDKGGDERISGRRRESRKSGGRGTQDEKQAEIAKDPVRKIEKEEDAHDEATSGDGDSRSGEKEGQKERRPRRHQSPSLLQRLLGLLRLLRRLYGTDEEGEWR